MQNNLFGKKLTYASLACDENYKDVKRTGNSEQTCYVLRNTVCEALKKKQIKSTFGLLINI